MYNQKLYHTQLIQALVAPWLGSPAVGYVYARSSQDLIDLELHRRRIAEFAESEGWDHSRWHEEFESNKDAKQLPFVAHLSNDASSQSQEELDDGHVLTCVRAVRPDRQESLTMRREGN